MKRLIVCLLLLAFALSLVGCAGSTSPTAGPSPAKPDKPIKETEPAVTEPVTEPTESEQPTEDPTEPTSDPYELPAVPIIPDEPDPTESEENAGGFTPELQAAYVMITEMYAEDGEYTVTFAEDDYSYDSYYSYYLPQINTGTDGADVINTQITTRFEGEINEAQQSIRNGSGAGLLSVGWFVFPYQNVMSLIVYDTFDFSWEGYEVYYYDMETGASYTPAQMLDRLVLTQEDFLAGVREAAIAQFETNYSGLDEAAKQDYGFYTQREKLDDPTFLTLDNTKFYVDEAGHIGVYAPIPSMAGADWYYELLYPTFAMG